MIARSQIEIKQVQKRPWHDAFGEDAKYHKLRRSSTSLILTSMLSARKFTNATAFFDRFHTLEMGVRLEQL